VTRIYPNFDILDELASQISKICSVIGFSDITTRSGQTKESLMVGLGKHLNSALKIHDLAQYEARKRFLEKHNATSG